MSGYDPIARLRDVVDTELGPQPADTTVEQLVTLVERALFERRRQLQDWQRATRVEAQKRGQKCRSCGRSDFAPAVDNTGAEYMGCVHCRIVLPPFPTKPVVG